MNSNLERVENSIGNLVTSFIRENQGKEFHAADLREYVLENGAVVAPSSPTRILQHLRKTGVIHYRLLSRSKSLYQSLRVAA